MLQQVEAITPELQLLLSCAKKDTCPEDEAKIRRLLGGCVDWTIFVGKAVDHGLVSLVGHTLVRVAPDMVPDDILDGFREVASQTLRLSRRAFELLAGVIQTLAKDGIEAIPLKGPVLAMRAYGDLALRESKDLDLLIREHDLPFALATLRRLGYLRKGDVSAAQLDLIHRLQGREILFHEASGTAIGIVTRLTPMNLVLDIDYAGLWMRAGRITLTGRSVPILTPEDELIVLAIQGAKEMWWRIKSACDAATFIGANPSLDWITIVERARAQGCLQMVLLAASLASKYFNMVVPDTLGAFARAGSDIDKMAAGIAAHWQAGQPIGLPSHATISQDRLGLHDGIVRQGRCIVRTLFLPRPYLVARVRLPERLSFAYVPIKIADDFIALPLQRIYRLARAQYSRLQHALRGSDLGRAKAAAPADLEREARNQQQATADMRPVPATNPTANAEDANTWVDRAQSLLAAKRFAEAVEASDCVLALNPENIPAMKIGINARIKSCDWRRREDDKHRITEMLRAGQSIVGPLNHRAICDSEAEHLVLAQLQAKRFQVPVRALWRGETYRHKKIRIAYISTDFREHVLSGAIVGCFEHHDKTRFETTAISLGPNDRSAMRQRLEEAFDRFIDVENLCDAEIAKTIRDLEIDIAIDQNGYSGNGRTGVPARRPAPVQVNYLAYPGTMGATFMDYIIADQTLIPNENQIYYTEQVVYLPHTYLPYDRKRPIAEKTPSRTDEGLPETGFVFACNNAVHKIGPEIFHIWMRLLAQVEDSVLWLKSSNPWAMSNLWREARAAGIAPERLVFAPPVQQIEDHLARLSLAGLFLDTLPYNAHATASDALWAGVPVLTCLGSTFPARVAASALYAAGLPDLVTSSLEQYEAMALALARDPERLAAIKEKLTRNRDTEPLFDTRRFTRDLEAAYTVMWERSQRGLLPKSFSVAK